MAGDQGIRPQGGTPGRFHFTNGLSGTPIQIRIGTGPNPPTTQWVNRLGEPQHDHTISGAEGPEINEGEAQMTPSPNVTAFMYNVETGAWFKQEWTGQTSAQNVEWALDNAVVSHVSATDASGNNVAQSLLSPWEPVTDPNTIPPPNPPN